MGVGGEEASGNNYTSYPVLWCDYTVNNSYIYEGVLGARKDISKRRISFAYVILSFSSLQTRISWGDFQPKIP